MPGEKLSNRQNISERPQGTREGDLSELADLTVMEIANNPKVNGRDAENARLEMARREREGEFNATKGQVDIWHDMAANGYAYKDGEILYPTDEYRAWLASDQSTVRPEKIHETIAERIASEGSSIKEQQNEDFTDEAESYQLRHDNRAIGKTALSEKTLEKRSKNYAKKQRELEKLDRMEFKTDEELDAEARSEYGSEEPSLEKPTEKEKNPDSYEELSEKLFNQYKHSFERKKSSWLEHGVVKNLEDGKLELRPDVLLRAGFIAEEADDIEKTFDPEGLSSSDAIWAGGELKRKVLSEVIDPGVKTLREETDTREIDKNGNTEITRRSDLSSAIYHGALYAMATGAYIDNDTGEVVYSLPTGEGDRLKDYIEQNALVDLGEYKQNDTFRQAAYQGIANILEAIKDKPSETEKGFKAIDWYFDAIKSKEHIQDFLDAMDGYEDPADSAWTAKLEEYRNHRPEIGEYLKHKNNKLQNIKSLTQISSDTFRQLSDAISQMNVSSTAVYNQLIELFGKKQKFPVYHPGIGPSGGARNIVPGAQKVGKAIAEFNNIQAIDPNVKVYACVFVESSGREVPYITFEYDRNKSHVATAVPIAVASNDSAYVWIGDKGDTGSTDWQSAFVGNPVTQTPTSKYAARQRTDVKAFNHISAMKTRGLNATDNMWYNINTYLLKNA